MINDWFSVRELIDGYLKFACGQIVLSFLFVSAAQPDMPGKPTKQAQDVPSPAGKATGQMFTLDKGSEAYILAYHDFPESISKANIDPQTLLKGASSGAVQNIDGKVTSERDITNGSYPGKEIVGSGSKDGKDIEFTIRLYWAKTRLVQALYLAEKGKTNQSNATKFLDSLKIS